MGNMILLPIAQALVLFHGYRLLAVRLPDDRVAVSLKALCRMLSLDESSQIKRIQRDKDLAGQLVLAHIDTPHGPQYTDVLMVEAIASWVLGLHLAKMASAKRPLILALKVEAVAVFYSYFSKTDAMQADQHALPEMPAPLPTLPPEQREASQQLALTAGEPRSEASDSIKEALEGLRMEVRSLRHELRAKTALDEARLARLEGAQVRMQARIDRLERRLAQLVRTVAQLMAEPLASLAQLVITERLVAAVIERHLLLEERVSRLEPKPPPRAKAGRPRKHRQP